MVQLVPMSDREFNESVERAIPRHAASCVRRGEWREEESIEASRRELTQSHPQGRRTPGQYFAAVVDEASAGRVGETWYSSQLQGGKVRFWVDWLWIDPEFRRKGFAMQVLELLALEARKQGAERMGLYVQSDNPGAIQLYEKLGFVARSMSMTRELDVKP